MALGALAGLAYLIAIGRFSWHPGLRSFADDAMSYLVMAQVLSPWASAPAAVQAAFASEIYPPLYPLLLAVTGVAFDVAAARLLTVVCGALALLAMLVYLRRALGSTLPAALGVALLALAYQWWILNLRVLSELPFTLLLLALLLVEGGPGGRHRRPAIVLLSVALVMTRSIGLVVVPALAVSAWMRRQREPQAPLTALLAGAATLGAWLAWSLLRPDGAGGRYTHSLAEITAALGSGRWLEALLPQLAALNDAWFGIWLPYWHPGLNALYLSLAGAGLAALCGLLMRLRQGRLDAWFALAYLGVLLLWPFPGQMTRFVLPIAPLLVLFAALAVQTGARRLAPSRAPRLVTLALALWLALSLPGLGFLYGRAAAPQALGLERIAEYYVIADLERAGQVAEQQLALFDDLARAREELPQQAVVMAFTPGFVALLGQRRAVGFPQQRDAAAWLRAIHDSPADHIHVSRYHPRRTSENALPGMAWLDGWTEILWSRHSRLDGRLNSRLYRIDRPALRRHIARLEAMTG